MYEGVGGVVTEVRDGRGTARHKGGYFAYAFTMQVARVLSSYDIAVVRLKIHARIVAHHARPPPTLLPLPSPLASGVGAPRRRQHGPARRLPARPGPVGALAGPHRDHAPPGGPGAKGMVEESGVSQIGIFWVRRRVQAKGVLERARLRPLTESRVDVGHTTMCCCSPLPSIRHLPPL